MRLLGMTISDWRLTKDGAETRAVSAGGALRGLEK